MTNLGAGTGAGTGTGTGTGAGQGGFLVSLLFGCELDSEGGVQ